MHFKLEFSKTAQFSTDRADPDSISDGLRIAVVDDHLRVRDTLALVLGRQLGFTVVTSGASGDDAVIIAGEYALDVMLLDINMPGNGIDAAKRIFAIAPTINLIMLTSSDDAHLVDAALAAGARAFVTKGEPVSVIADTIRRVAAGGSYVSPSLAARLLSSSGFGSPWTVGASEGQVDFFDREEQILRRLAQGLTNAEIAEGTGLSEPTVAAFMTNILMKLHTHTLADQLANQSPGFGPSNDP